MIILDRAPIIFTKDVGFMERISSSKSGILFKPGRIILLPEDAVLLRAPDEKGEKYERKM